MHISLKGIGNFFKNLTLLEVMIIVILISIGFALLLRHKSSNVNIEYIITDGATNKTYCVHELQLPTTDNCVEFTIGNKEYDICGNYRKITNRLKDGQTPCQEGEVK